MIWFYSNTRSAILKLQNLDASHRKINCRTIRSAGGIFGLPGGTARMEDRTISREIHNVIKEDLS
jgi:hypothetical protein